MGFLFNYFIKPNIINRISKMEKRIMASIADLKSHVEAQGSVIQSAVALLQGLHDKLVAAGTDAEALEEVKTQLQQNTQSLADAVAKNTVADGEVNQ